MNTNFHRKRTKRRWAFFLLSVVMFFCIPIHFVTVQAETAHETATAGRVLFLSSYSYAWDTVQIQIEGIKEGIGSDIELDYEFMDTKRVDDVESRRLFILGREVNLTAREFELLELFVTNQNKVFSREKLLELVWGTDYPGDVRTVDVHVRRLREKIEANPSEPKYVHTKWGVGYYYRG